MKVAISYKDNMIFEHFGKSESFKIYTIENGEILNSEVIDTNGTGHEALALFLKDLGVDVVICGGFQQIQSCSKTGSRRRDLHSG